MTEVVDIPGGSSGLLVCCRYLAERAGEDGLAAQIDQLAETAGPAGIKEILEGVVRAARKEGLKAVIERPAVEQLSAMLLPVVAELWGGRYLVITGIEKDTEGSPSAIALLDPNL
jgi:ABC-type bacteriocin/lantibiotic exporter with double-glycine peptidase domain